MPACSGAEQINTQRGSAADYLRRGHGRPWGKHSTKVKFLVAGPGVTIGNACVDLCNNVVAKARALTR